MSEAQRHGSGAHHSFQAKAPLTDRANNEPAIMRGLTASETQIAAFVALPVWTVIGVLVALITRVWALGILIASLAPMLTVWFLAGWLATIKRDRPENYYFHRFWHWLAKNGLAKSPFVNHNGYWEIGREFNNSPSSRSNK